MSRNESASSKVATWGARTAVELARAGTVDCSGFGWLSLAERTGCLATGTTLRRDELYASPKKCQRLFVTHLTKNEPTMLRLTGQFRPPYTLPSVRVRRFTAR